MKRFIVLLMVFLLLGTTVSYAETEEKAHEIFNNLAEIYDSSLYFLNQRQITWDNILNAKAADVSDLWVLEKIIAPNKNRSFEIAHFTVSNGYSDPYNDLFVPLYDYYGHNDKGVQSASFAFTTMVYFDTGLKARLDEQKAAIKELKSTDYEYQKELQELYKKTSQVLDYAIEGSDSYINTSQRISDYEQVRREQKSEFDFIFDWPEFSYKAHQMDPAYKAIYEAGQQQIEKAYENATELESKGEYWEAAKAFHDLQDYKDSKDKTKTCYTQWKEINKVKSMTYEQYYSGAKVTDNMRNPSKANSYETHVYSYDNTGKLIRIEIKGSIPKKIEIQYDEEGKIKSGKESGQWSDDKQYTYTAENMYDEHGNCIQSKKTYRSPNSHIKKDGAISVYSHKYEYDENGNIIHDTYTCDGEIQYDEKYEYSFDDFGRIVSCISISVNGKRGRNIINYNYDSNGLLTKKTEGPEKASGLHSYIFEEYTYTIIRNK